LNDFRVVIPDESFSIIEFRQQELPGVALINTALRGFEPKVVFAWHLSIMLQLDELIENGMPSPREREIVDDFGDRLDAAIKGDEPDKPNSLFLGQITWNDTRELLWRIFDPEAVNAFLQSILNADADLRPRPMDYRMDHDPEWKLAEWHLRERDS
jgi:hypothetical protein